MTPHPGQSLSPRLDSVDGSRGGFSVVLEGEVRRLVGRYSSFEEDLEGDWDQSRACLCASKAPTVSNWGQHVVVELLVMV
jgi:hypothetical protein